MVSFQEPGSSILGVLASMKNVSRRFLAVAVLKISLSDVEVHHLLRHMMSLQTKSEFHAK